MNGIKGTTLFSQKEYLRKRMKKGRKKREKKGIVDGRWEQRRGDKKKVAQRSKESDKGTERGEKAENAIDVYLFRIKMNIKQRHAGEATRQVNFFGEYFFFFLVSTRQVNLISNNLIHILNNRKIDELKSSKSNFFFQREFRREFGFYAVNKVTARNFSPTRNCVYKNNDIKNYTSFYDY